MSIISRRIAILRWPILGLSLAALPGLALAQEAQRAPIASDPAYSFAAGPTSIPLPERGSVSQVSSVMPSGGRVVAGSAAVSVREGGALVIDQSTRRAILDWNSFSVGADGKVHFNNGSGATLNRVTGDTVSSINGRLTGTGSVYLLNPNGIVVGEHGVIDIGGTFIASTLGMDPAAFMGGGPVNLIGTSSAAVVNYGKIGSLGGDVSLIAARVENEGELHAAHGTIALAAGFDVTLHDHATAGGKLSVRLAPSDASVTNVGDIEAAMVEIRTNGGNIYALAGNTGGTIRATGFEERGGRVFLIAERGHLRTDGNLVATGSNSFVETSGENVDFAGLTVRADNWLVDPSDIVIDAAAAATLSSNLSSTNIELRTLKDGTGGNGDIFVNSAVNWSSNRTLTLSAYRNIGINANLTSTGGGAVVLRADNEGISTGTVNFAGGAQISTPGSVDIFYNPTSYATPTNYASHVTSDALLTSYMLVNDVRQLQAIDTNLAGGYALGRDIDASSTVTWNNGAGFTPIGTGYNAEFRGVFDGQGRSISGLSINRPNAADVGVFGVLLGIIRDVRLVDASVTGAGRTAALVGRVSRWWDGSAQGSISNAHVSGNVMGVGGTATGGLIGWNDNGIINQSSSSATVVSSGSWVGGLVGWSTGDHAIVENSWSSGSVGGSSTSQSVGGLVGTSSSGSRISGSYSTAYVGGTGNLGGLVGFNSAFISSSWASASVARTIITGSNTAGGLVGSNDAAGTIQTSYATGLVAGGTAGGLVGANSGLLTTSYASGSVTGTSSTGGLVGQNSGTVSSSYAAGSVKGSNAGGLIGSNHGLLEDVYSVASVLLQGGSGGGVAGSNHGTIRRAFATGSIQGVGNWFGGLVGLNAGAIEHAYWDAGTTRFSNGIGASNTGSAITNSQAIGGATGISPYSTSTYDGLDFSSTWFLITGSTRPFLRSEWSSVIRTPHQLQLMQMDLSASYVLASNLNMEALRNPQNMWNSERGFAPVGTGFMGSLDGRGHTISSLYIVADRFAALFSGNYGTIQNVNILGSMRTSQTYGDHAAGLSAFNYGIIRNVHTNVDVSGGSLIGTLVGSNSGTIVGSSGSGSVGVNNSQGGGLTGRNYSSGTITDSYSTASVRGTHDVGGLVGWNDGKINRTVASGFVSTGGGLVGRNYGSTSELLNSRWDQSSTGRNVAVALNDGVVSNVRALGGTNGLDPFTSSSYGASWDFNSTWYMIEGDTRPFLRSEHSRFISNEKQLQLMQLDPAGTYALIGDINASSTSQSSGMWRTAAGFVPVWAASGFDGTLEGNGFKITGLHIGRADSNNVGLFSAIGSSGVVRNLGIAGTIAGQLNVGGIAGTSAGTLESVSFDGQVTGAAHVGGLAGLSSGTISNASVSGTVNGTEAVGGVAGINLNIITGSSFNGVVNAQYDAGGIAGINHATVTKSQATITLQGVGGLGGLIGGNFGSLTSSSASGSVEGGYILGGLTGLNRGSIGDILASVAIKGSEALGGGAGVNAGTILNARVTGKVDGLYDLGGLAGINHGSIFGSSAEGAVKGIGGVGGLTGWNFGTIAESFAKGTVTAGYLLGGTAGVNYGKITSSRAEGNVEGVEALGGLVGVNAGTITGSEATGQVKGQSDTGGLVGINHGSVLYSSASGAVSGLGGIGGLIGVNISTGQVGNSAATGSVNGNYLVGGLTGLNHGSIVWSNASGPVNGIEAIGGLVGVNVGQIQDSNATGKADGHYDLGGLVGINHGAITRSTASGAVSGKGGVGGFAGWNYGWRTYSAAFGHVKGGYLLGGLVGINVGILNSASASGNVEGVTTVGGLVGWNRGEVLAVFATSNVTASDTGGGLVGRNDGTITQAYARGAAMGEGSGGLVGLNLGEVRYGYWNADNGTTGIGSGSGTLIQVEGIGGETGKDPNKADTYEGFDFESRWKIKEGEATPELKSAPMPTVH